MTRAPKAPVIEAPVILVLGGTRSGKSAFAEGLVAAAPKPVYIATAEALDGEMQARIQAHRDRRGPAWAILEAPLALPETLQRATTPETALLVDSVSLWLSNLLLAKHDLEAATADLLAGLERPAGPVVLVGDEVGGGIVPETPLGRRFRDQCGLLNQRLAARADRVYLVVAGQPLVLKGPGAVPVPRSLY